MIQTLKSYQNTTDHCNGSGVFVGQDGDTYNILQFDEKSVEYASIDRIATALSRIYRYAGNSKMTVAQHCVRGADALLLMGDPLLAFDFLMHECSEPMGINDLGSPFKKMIKNVLDPIEHGIELALSKKFGFRYPFPKEIKQIDTNLAQDEMFMMKHNTWFDYWEPSHAKQQWLEMYDKLKIYIEEYNHKQLI